MFRNHLQRNSQNLTVADEFYSQEGVIGDRIGKYEEIKSFEQNVSQLPILLLRNPKSKAHSIDSCRTEPEQLTDPPSVEGDSFGARP